MSTCFVCGLAKECRPYRLGGTGVVLVLLCATCGGSLEETISAWLDRMQQAPRQAELFEGIAS